MAPLVVLDSPLSAVEPRTARRVMALGVCDWLCGAGCTVVMSSNSLAEVRKADIVMLLDAAGAMVYCGPFESQRDIRSARSATRWARR
jgi:ABC-type cobalamin transport system ATPase subunit